MHFRQPAGGESDGSEHRHRDGLTVRGASAASAATGARGRAGDHSARFRCTSLERRGGSTTSTPESSKDCGLRRGDHDVCEMDGWSVDEVEPKGKTEQGPAAAAEASIASQQEGCALQEGRAEVRVWRCYPRFSFLGKLCLTRRDSRPGFVGSLLLMVHLVRWARTLVPKPVKPVTFDCSPGICKFFILHS